MSSYPVDLVGLLDTSDLGAGDRARARRLLDDCDERPNQTRPTRLLVIIDFAGADPTLDDPAELAQNLLDVFEEDERHTTAPDERHHLTLYRAEWTTER